MPAGPRLRVRQAIESWEYILFKKNGIVEASTGLEVSEFRSSLQVLDIAGLSIAGFPQN